MKAGLLYRYRPDLPIKGIDPGRLDVINNDFDLINSIIEIVKINGDVVIGKFNSHNYYTMKYNLSLNRTFVFSIDQLRPYLNSRYKNTFIAYEPHNKPGPKLGG